jgi:hypothetical protein
MFEPFSRNYYLGRFYVEPHDGDHAAVNGADHERTNRQLYAANEGVEPLDTPLVMKFDGHGHHFPVVGDDAVPSGTLAVPDHLSDGGLPGRRELFLATPDRADELLRYAGYTVNRAGSGGSDGPGDPGTAR